MWRAVLAYKNYLIALLTPLVFLPLPLVLPYKVGGLLPAREGIPQS